MLQLVQHNKQFNQRAKSCSVTGLTENGLHWSHAIQIVGF